MNADQLLDLLHGAVGGLVGDPGVVGSGVGGDAMVLDHGPPQLLGAVREALLVEGVDDGCEELERRRRPRRRFPEEVERGVGAGGEAERLGEDAVRDGVPRDGGMRGEDGGHEPGQAAAAQEWAENRVQVRGSGRRDGSEQRGGAVGEAHRGEGRERGDGVGGEQGREGRVDVVEAASAGELAKTGDRDGELGFLCRCRGGGEEPAAGGGEGCGGHSAEVRS